MIVAQLAKMELFKRQGSCRGRKLAPVSMCTWRSEEKEELGEAKTGWVKSIKSFLKLIGAVLFPAFIVQNCMRMCIYHYI